MQARHAGFGRTLACLAALLVSGYTLARAGGREDSKGCAAVAPGPGESSPHIECCYTNRAFTGVCRVRPARDETCATILTYLNDPQSQGKSYCGGTTIRSGWQQIPCEAPPPSGPVESEP